MLFRSELDEQVVFKALIDREKLGSTGFGNGIAIPHCRLEGCTSPVSALLHLQEKIDFDAIDGAPVDLLFVLLVPQADAEHPLMGFTAGLGLVVSRRASHPYGAAWNSGVGVDVARRTVLEPRAAGQRSVGCGVWRDPGYGFPQTTPPSALGWRCRRN